MRVCASKHLSVRYAKNMQRNTSEQHKHKQACKCTGQWVAAGTDPHVTQGQSTGLVDTISNQDHGT